MDVYMYVFSLTCQLDQTHQSAGTFILIVPCVMHVTAQKGIVSQVYIKIWSISTNEKV